MIEGKFQTKTLLLMAFIEGASVMACELLGAKMIAPFFGSSLYVWAAVLGVTLSGLMLGYYSGGFLSEKIKKENLVNWVLLLAGMFLMIMPYTSVWIMTNNLEMSIKWGSTLSLLVFMFPPLVLMGMSSPIIINMINTKLDETGKKAGAVYAISTLGGIFSTFIVGFYLLPEFGIKWPCFFFGFLLMLIPAILLFRRKQFAAALFVLPAFITFNVNSKTKLARSGEIDLLYESEGVFGQVRVYDMPIYTEAKGTKQGRVLSVNNTLQSLAEKNDLKYSLWDWSVVFPTAASVYPAGSDLLLMGLGGGMLYHQFDRLKFNIDVVELDERIKDVAIDYFAIDSTANIIVDDARRYINTCKKKYDVIVLDLFHNETPPTQVPTIESFDRIKGMLNENGMVLMNFYGYLTGEKGKGARSVIKTFEEAGFILTPFVTPGEEAYRNLILCATLKQPDWSLVNYSEKDLFTITPDDISKFVVEKSTIDMSDAEVLTDKKPKLEKMYIDAALEWRRHQIDFALKRVLNTDHELVK